MPQAVHQNIVAVRAPQVVNHQTPLHALGDAKNYVWIARFLLLDMIKQCRTMPPIAHRREMGRVHAELQKALGCLIGPSARETLGAMADDLQLALHGFDSITVDVLASLYAHAEMKISSVLLADEAMKGAHHG